MRIDTSARRLLVATVLAVLTLVPVPIVAQTVTDPTRAEFSPSPDHDASATDGTPILSRYDLEFYMLGAAAPFQTQSLDKPAPGTDGLIRVPLTSTAMPAGMVFESRVRAVGPGGSLASDTSNPFMYSVACTYAVSPASHSFAAVGGAGSQTLTTGAGCDWVAASSATWLAIASNGTSGTGSATISFTVSSNAATSTRTSTLTIGGQPVTITQAGMTPCAPTVSTTTTSFAASGGSGSSTVNAGSGCTWTATSGSSWITISAGGSGSGSGTVSFAVAANTTTAPRQGSLTVAGQTVQIGQAAASSCAFTLSPTSQPFGPGGGTGTGNVATASGCQWAASSGSSWITIASGATGAGSGAVGYRVAAYSGTGTRTGTVTVAGQVLTITQSGQTTTCTPRLTPTAVQLGSENNSQGSVSVTLAAGCAWTAQSNVTWVTIAGGASGSGSGVVTLRASRNSSSQPRTGTITVAGQTVNVTQVSSTSGHGPTRPRGFRRVRRWGD